MLATDTTPSLVRERGATVHRIASLQTRRSRVRRMLNSRAPTIRYLAEVAGYFAEGADPLDAVAFIEALRDQCDAVIRAARR